MTDQEDQSTPNVPEDKEYLGPGMGYIIPCGMCGEKVWIYEYNDDLVYLCGPCGDLIPD